MNENNFRIAISLLQAIADMLPAGNDVEEKYVVMYHSTLTNIQSETGRDLAAFFIPESELTYHVTSMRSGPRLPRFDTGPDINYSKERYCDEVRFSIALKGAVNYLNSWVLYPNGLPTINFAKPN